MNPKSSQAENIFDVSSTGVNSSGAPLPNGTIGDPHYTLMFVPDGSTTDLVIRTSVGGWPIPPYIGDDSKSAWITPNDSLVNNLPYSPVGTYDYRTTFDLTGFNLASVSIKGGWSTDNNGVSILLNGIDTGNPGTSFTQFATGLAPFTISSGFRTGINTLDFIVDNGDCGGCQNPTALRVEMSGTATPEPSTLLMLGSGVLGLAGVIRRRLSL